MRRRVILLGLFLFMTACSGNGATDPSDYTGTIYSRSDVQGIPGRPLPNVTVVATDTVINSTEAILDTRKDVTDREGRFTVPAAPYVCTNQEGYVQCFEQPSTKFNIYLGGMGGSGIEPR